MLGITTWHARWTNVENWLTKEANDLEVSENEETVAQNFLCSEGIYQFTDVHFSR